MPDDRTISLQDMKTIVHGLKMSGFAFLEGDVLDAVNERVKNLPSSEALDGIYEEPRYIKELTAEIGELMDIIDKYGTKNSEYKARYKSKTKLPPRYKVLDWRDNVKKAELVTEIVKLSKNVDDRGHSLASKSLMRCAKDIASLKDPNVSSIVDKYANDLTVDELKILKVAQEYGGGYGGTMSAENNSQDMTSLMKSLMTEDVWTEGMAQQYLAAYGQIFELTETLTQQTEELASQASDPNIQHSMSTLNQANQDLMSSMANVKDTINQALMSAENFTQWKAMMRQQMSGDGFAFPQMADAVNDIVKLSQKTEAITSHNISGKLVVCAKKLATNDNSFLKEANEAGELFRLAGMDQEADLFLEKTSGLWDKMKGKVHEWTDPGVEQQGTPERVKADLNWLERSWDNVVKFFNTYSTESDKLAQQWGMPGFKETYGDKFAELAEQAKKIQETVNHYDDPNNFTFDSLFEPAQDADGDGQPDAPTDEVTPEEAVVALSPELLSAFEVLKSDVTGRTLEPAQIDFILSHLQSMVKTAKSYRRRMVEARLPQVPMAGAEKDNGAEFSTLGDNLVYKIMPSLYNQQKLDQPSVKALINYFTKLKSAPKDVDGDGKPDEPTAPTDMDGDGKPDEPTLSQEQVQAQLTESAGYLKKGWDQVKNIIRTMEVDPDSITNDHFRTLDDFSKDLEKWQMNNAGLINQFEGFQTSPSTALAPAASSKGVFNLKHANTQRYNQLIEALKGGYFHKINVNDFREWMEEQYSSFESRSKNQGVVNPQEEELASKTPEQLKQLGYNDDEIAQIKQITTNQGLPHPSNLQNLTKNLPRGNPNTPQISGS